jgi:hypothetical protein
MSKPACKEFRSPLLATLAELSGGRAGIPIEMSKTYAPVLSSLGITEGEYGDSAHGTPWTLRQIGLAMRALRKAGFTDAKRKAQWELTEMGLRAVKDGFVGVQDAPDVPEDTTEEDGSLATVLHLPIAPSPYDEDPYLRALAVQLTPCFGLYAPREAACGACLLASSCVHAVDARYAEIAAELELEDAKLLAASRVQNRSKDKQDLSVSELIKLDTPPLQKTVATAASRVVSQVTGQVETVCQGCGGKIPKGTDAKWVPEVGMFHNQCDPELSK